MLTKGQKRSKNMEKKIEKLATKEKNKEELKTNFGHNWEGMGIKNKKSKKDKQKKEPHKNEQQKRWNDFTSLEQYTKGLKNF